MDRAIAVATDGRGDGQAMEGESSGGLGWAWYGLGVLLMTTLFALVIRQMLSLIAPGLQASLHFSDFQIGMLQGLGMAIFACVASYPMGWLADRYGRRLLLAIGVGIWSLATFFCAFQDSFGGLFAGTIGIAIGEAGLAPIVYAMIPDLFPERKRNAANLIFYGGSLFGTGIGMALGGAMLQWLAASPASLPAWLAGIDSWRIAMVAIALPGPLFLLLVATMPLRAHAAPSTMGAPMGPAVGVDDAAAGFLPYARAHWRTLGGVFGAIFAMGVAMMAGLVWYPIALPRAFGVDPASVGVGLGTAVTAATAIGVFLPGMLIGLARRAGGISPIRAASVFFWMAPLPALFLPFAATPFQAYAVAALQGAAGVAGSALMPGILQDLSPSHLRSRVLSLLGIFNALAMALSPLAIGALSGAIAGPRGMLYAIAIVSIPSLVVAALLVSLARRPFAATVRAMGFDVTGNHA
ncbi:MFS transporter [Sphingomonas colocasiae]|uniref:MFS transporter n=1 Tax=Sphingomonas colocasiae TaxID=1848973 RepID=A0ABS7PUC9_9SPHN|nr:MFS transporter [Sphingomonas colocasiae]MBY8824949.1 MFS transporter [Sphingomonas colocasiae]